jgi:dTDP-4-dehydrorhamnose reductase
VGPVNQYGISKLAGEQAIVASGCKYLIFRTSWVYASRGSNFARTMLRLASEQKVLSVIADQVGAPTGADLIADITAHAILRVKQRPQLQGLYHLAASGEVSWHGYASYVLEFARVAGKQLEVTNIVPINTESYPTPARRPRNSRLNTQKLRNSFSLCLPDWQSGVTRMLMEILNNDNE